MSRIIMTSIQEAKAALRKDLKQRLAVMTDKDRSKQSEVITQKLFSLPEYKSSQRVCLYLHMKEEVQTYNILKNVLQTNKAVFIPQYIGSNMKMVQLSSLAEYENLPETKWKIKQPPDDDVRRDALETGGLDLILIPGLGFTVSGDRIGRGKGYYDTYLEKCHTQGFKPRTIALAYRQQICDSIPVSQTDMKIDLVLYPHSEDL